MPRLETNASKMRLRYAAAAGDEIQNLGEVMLPMVTAEGTRGRMKTQVAEVTKPLASVKRLREAGHTVVFDEVGSYVFNKETGQVNFSVRKRATTCWTHGAA